MKALTSLRIGIDCFHIEDRANRMNRTFDIVDCRELQSILTGTHSFIYYSGGFGLEWWVYLSKLKTIILGNHAFETQECIELSGTFEWMCCVLLNRSSLIGDDHLKWFVFHFS